MHLKSHKITVASYLEMFPGSKLMSEETSKKYSDNAKKQNISRDYSDIGEKISKTKKQKFASGELVQWNTGIQLSKEQKLKLSIIAKKGYASGERIHHNTGIPLKEEIKRKISLSLRDSYAKSDIKVQRDLINIKNKKEHDEHLITKILIKLQKVDSILSESKLFLLGDKQEVIVRSRGSISIQCSCCDNISIHTRQMIDPSKIKTLKCRTCNPVPLTSKGQLELFNFIQSLGELVKLNDRDILGGKEIDIYLPDKKVGFEYNGLYWHSEAVSGQPKHLLWKQQFAFNKGVTLYHIFEDEWMNKREIVKSRIRQILNLQIYKKDARKCKLDKATSNESKEFLDENHIQGFDRASIRYCLRDEQEEIIALMTFKKTTFVKGRDSSMWELSRFSVKRNLSIRGAASRLLRAFEREYNPISLLTYADRRWSFGKVYHSLGFKFQHFATPGYWYLQKNVMERLHRSRFMKHLLIKDGANPESSEREIMEQLGYDRIWDCGNLVFIKEYEQNNK